MAVLGEDLQKEQKREPISKDDNDKLKEDENAIEESKTILERTKMENLFRQMRAEWVPPWVHDVVIKGNTNSKESLIEAEVI